VTRPDSQPRLTVAPVEKAKGRGWESSSVELQESRSGFLRDDPDDPPCVLFEAKPSLEIVSVSKNVTDLLGVDIASVMQQPSFLQDCVAAEDRYTFQEKIADLENSGSVSFVHRFVQASGLPVWVSHSLRKIERNGETVVRGCLVPISGASRLLALEQEVVSRFIHKLGNQFQLLNLVVASLHTFLPESRESEVLQESLEKAIELTRVLSDCNQTPAWVSEIHLLEIVRAAAETRANDFAAAGVRLETNFDAIAGDAFVLSSPYLLEAALGNILQNALEASVSGSRVGFAGCLRLKDSRPLVSLQITDNGCGMSASVREQVLLPFFTTKKGRDGLGLTVASRFVELHGGALGIDSREGEGTEVTILLPVERRRDADCA
jgi:hypothetical protein